MSQTSSPIISAEAREDYLTISARPLQSLVFLMPLLLAYEVGSLVYTTDYQTGQISSIKARRMLLDFIGMFVGDLALYLPGLMLIVLLIFMHLFRRDTWRLYPWMYMVMCVESIMLTLPLVLFAILWCNPQAGVMTEGWQRELVYAIGAGLYEELVFRVMLIIAVHALLADLLKWDSFIATTTALVVSAVCFALYHFHAGMPFSIHQAFFYGIAGLYFGILYLHRGFGICAATHAMYDVAVVAVQYGLLLDR